MNAGLAKVVNWLQANTDLEVDYTGITISVTAICDEDEDMTAHINVYHMGENRYSISTYLHMDIEGLWCPEVHQVALDKLTALLAKAYNKFKEGFVVT